MDEYVERIQEQGYCVVPGVYQRPAIDKALGLIRDLAARPREHRDEDLPPLGSSMTIYPGHVFHQAAVGLLIVAEDRVA